MALVTGLVTLAIDLDRIPNLIARSPYRYVRAWVMVRRPRLAWVPAFKSVNARILLPGDSEVRSLDPGCTFRTTRKEQRADGTTVIHSEVRLSGQYHLVSDEEEIAFGGWRRAQATAPLTTVVIRVAMLAFVAWFIVLAPLQYATSAVFGAPDARTRPHRRIQLQPPVRPAGPHGRRHPTDCAEVQFYSRLVTTTLAISSLVLWLISLLPP